LLLLLLLVLFILSFENAQYCQPVTVANIIDSMGKNVQVYQLSAWNWLHRFQHMC